MGEAIEPVDAPGKHTMTETSPPDNITRLGWREWIALPELVSQPIKAKLDTGARTSTLHAAWLEPGEATEDGTQWLRFAIHRSKRRRRLIECHAPVTDWRAVTDSGGHREHRYVIETLLQLGDLSRRIEITLTNRDTMLFPMLLGRTALRELAVVDPAASYTLGRPGKTRKVRDDPKRTPDP